MAAPLADDSHGERLGRGLFVFCFVGSVQQGMDDLQERQETKQSLIMFQANKFCPATSHLPQDYESKIKRLDGVREVVPIQVFTNNCRASLDVIVFYGVPPKKLRTARDFELLSGDWAEFEQHQDCGRRRPGRRQPSRAEGRRQVLDRRSDRPSGGQSMPRTTRPRRTTSIPIWSFCSAARARTWSAR